MIRYPVETRQKLLNKARHHATGDVGNVIKIKFLGLFGVPSTHLGRNLGLPASGDLQELLGIVVQDYVVVVKTTKRLGVFIA